MDANWVATNQETLTSELARVRQSLERLISSSGDEAPDVPLDTSHVSERSSAPSPSHGSSAIDHVSSAFGLSEFERDLLLLCAGVELDSRFASLCAQAHGRPGFASPTFSLALACIPGAHWSAATPGGPLRRYRMIEVEPGQVLTMSPLRIDERILHFLAGINQFDERIARIVDLVPVSGVMVPSHQRVVDQAVELWADRSGTTMPIIHLRGDNRSISREIAAHLCAIHNMHLYQISMEALMATPGEIEALIRLLEREAIITGNAYLIEPGHTDTPDPARLNTVSRVIDSLGAPIIVSTPGQLQPSVRSTRVLTVEAPHRSEQMVALQGALGESAYRLNGQIEDLVSQFDLGPQVLQAARSLVAEMAVWESDEELGRQLWETVRESSRGELDGLAQRVSPSATWEDLILPEPQLQTLADIAVHVRQRSRVYEHWGFADKGLRGLGISALFSGASGTGKTMAAEVLANELRLDLYRIDLSAVVSKYIGETEKNLKRVFDAAEGGGAILLFDEADALFGKRSEVRDSHDRYANIEVSYLLQRMEAYRGLAILTTNLKSGIDSAFLRRIRFIVQFPFPDAQHRARIWSRIFPDRTPVADIDVEKLSRLNVSGGTIRNIALNATFLAADENEAVSMSHLLRAARSEYVKLEKTLTEAESGGWL